MQKLLALLLVLAALSIGSFFLIFEQGLIGGIMFASAGLIFCAAVFVAGIIGAIYGKVDFFKIRNTGEAVGAILFATILFTVISVVAAVNSFVEFTIDVNDLGYEEKMRLFAGTIFQVPAQSELLSEEKNGVTYYFAEANKDEIEKMDQLLQKKREELTAFLGTEDAGGLAIEFHEDYESMEEHAGMDDVSGFYNTLNRTIHLVPDDLQWEAVLMHEYTHYQSHLFAMENNLSITHVPHWFEEGVAEYFADASNYWFDLEAIELVKFHKLDDLDDFDASATETFDPYAQSYLAVEALVRDHGENVIVELLASESVKEFYGALEDMTGQGIGEFQATFLDEMITEQNHMETNFDDLYAAMQSRRFKDADRILGMIKETGDVYDIDEAYWVMTDGYLKHGLYDLSLKLVESKMKQEDGRFRVDDLLLAAEIQLLADPEQSLLLAIEAKEEAQATDQMDYHDFSRLISAYQKINSSSAAEGYKMLVEEGLIYNGFVAADLESKLKREYPEQF